jgi:hypothetical protein
LTGDGSGDESLPVLVEKFNLATEFRGQSLTRTERLRYERDPPALFRPIRVPDAKLRQLIKAKLLLGSAVLTAKQLVLGLTCEE